MARRRSSWVLAALLAWSSGAASLALPQAASAGVAAQYDYDAQGRLCRARLPSGKTINYTYDSNNNRKVVTQLLTGGATTSTACPMVTGVPAGVSPARPRSNHAPTIPTLVQAKACWQSVILNSGWATACPEQQVNLLRYAFDFDFNSITILSAAVTSGPGSVRVDANKLSIWVTPPASGPDGVQTTILYTVKDSVGATATGTLTITFYTSSGYVFI